MSITVKQRLLHLYADEGRTNFSYRDLQAVSKGYRPGNYRMDIDERQRINRDLEEMQSAGLIKLRREKSEECFSIYGGTFLPPMEEYAKQAGMTTPAVFALEVRQSIGSLELKTEKLNSLIHEMIEASEKKANFYGFLTKDPRHTAERDSLTAADRILSGEFMRGMYLRDVSKAIFNDSKRLETSAVMSRVCQLLQRCADASVISDIENDDDKNADKILKYFGIMKTPYYIMFCGDARIITEKGTIRTCGFPYLFSSNLISEYQHIYLIDKTMMTIENKTTYEDFSVPGTSKFYTGGFPGVAERALLKRIAYDNPEASFFHWSDIDCGGFRIFENVKKYIPMIQPYKMDVSALQENEDFLSRLTQRDRSVLNRMIYTNGPFTETILYMLAHNVKLEQESIYA